MHSARLQSAVTQFNCQQAVCPPPMVAHQNQKLLLQLAASGPITPQAVLRMSQRQRKGRGLLLSYSELLPLGWSGAAMEPRPSGQL